jgi:hypothetical protein
MAHRIREEMQKRGWREGKSEGDARAWRASGVPALSRQEEIEMRTPLFTLSQPMRRPTGPCRGGRRLAPAGRAARLPDRDARSKKKKSRKEQRGARSGRSGGAFAVVAGMVVAAAVALAARAFGFARKGSHMLAEATTKPLHYTEHARCRMKCR